MNIGCVVMAAGLATRFGGDKLLHPIDGVPILRRTFSALTDPRFFPRIAVVPAECAVIGSIALACGFQTVLNEHPQDGLSVSVRLGLAAAEEADAILFAVGDQPFLCADSVSRLLDLFETKNQGCMAALAYHGSRGNPVVFSRTYYDELRQLSGDRGGSSIIAAHPDRLLLCEAGSARELFDVDRKEDLSC